MRTLALCATLSLTAASACGSSDPDEPKLVHETVADALTRSVQFENGLRHRGDIARLDSEAGTVTLEASTARLQLAPGAAMILPLDVTTDAGDTASATLLQFEGSDSHTEVPIDDNAEASDGGSGSDALHVENAFDVSDDVCDHLCNQVFQARLLFAIQLQGGAVSRQVSIVVTLDCSDDGDAKLCDDASSGEPSSGGSDGGGGIVVPGHDDAGMGQVGTPDGGALDGSTPTPTTDAGPGPSGVAPPQVVALTPETASASMPLTLTIMGTDFSADATAYLDGVALETTVVNDTTLEVVIPADSVTAGSLLVYVENAPGDPSSRSNVLYIQVAPAPGAPIIYDYSPDNGVAGDTILIIASNLAGQTLTIEDEDGTELLPGTLGTISWPTAGTVDTVEVVLPAAISTGPITLGNPLGSYRGKIFSVGMNLTRAAGTVVEASSEYNTTNWSKVSGADNNLATSYFTANGDCATNTTCTTVPFFTITFADAQTVGRISMRGNREYASGYDFIRGTFEVLGATDGVLWDGTYDLPAPDRDLDIVLPTPVRGASSVRFTSLEDESTEPGFSEIEVFAK